MTDFETLVIEMPETGIMRIILDRPKSRNAQNTQLLCELNEAFDIGAHDDSIKVIMKQTIHIAWNGRALPAALPAHSLSTFIWSGDK